MQTTWVVAADSSRARIFEVLGKERRLLEVADLVNPDGRSSERELKSDAQGRYYGHGGGPRRGHSAGEASAVEHATEAFSRELSRYLDKARTDHQFRRLYLMAPPKFLGLLRQNLSGEVQKLVAEEIDKDLSWLDAREIDRQIRRNRT